MKPGRSLARALPQSVVVFLLVKLGVLISNSWWFPSLREAEDQPVASGSHARTALLIPMRNEIGSLESTLPGFLAAGFDEVVFLDDESEDGSADVVRAAVEGRSRQQPPVTVMTGEPRPGGWAGKTWACSQLAQATEAEILVFCDADVVLLPGIASSLVFEMSRQSATVFSVFCRQLTLTWAERLLIPLITDVVLCFLPFGLLSMPVPSAATASGALLAFRREAYDRLGGFGAVRGELVEDLAIARRARRLGEKLGLALGADLAQVRMYDGFGSVIKGMGRSLSPANVGGRWVLAAGWAWHVIAYTVPAVSVLLRRKSPWWRSAGAMAVLERIIVEAKTGGRDWPAAALVGLSPLAAGPVVAQALRRRQSWKGRTYG